MSSRKHRLADMTWVEFRDRRTENPTILLPFGSQEEQGPHAPMGDYRLTEIIADRVAEQAGALVAPIIPFGYADYFRTVPGGIALRAETFKAIVHDVCANFLDHELDHLVIFNGHSGNFPLIDQATREIKQTRGVIIPCLNLWRLIPDALWSEVHPGKEHLVKGHGAEPLTSVYQHLLPELMRMDLITREENEKTFLDLPAIGLGGVRFDGLEIAVPLDVTDRCGNGIAGGDPSHASAQTGARITDHLVEFSVAFLDHFKRTQTTTSTGRKP